MNNTDKVWLITGSSTGLGRALAQAVLERGYHLVATARQPEQLKELSDRYPDRVTTIALDVTNPQSMIQVVESDNPPLRLALGEDSVNIITQKLESMKAELEAWKDVSMNTAFKEVKASVG